MTDFHFARNLFAGISVGLALLLLVRLTWDNAYGFWALVDVKDYLDGEVAWVLCQLAVLFVLLLVSLAFTYAFTALHKRFPH